MAKDKIKKDKKTIHPLALLGGGIIGLGLLGLILFNPFIQKFSFFDKFIEFVLLIGEFFDFYINHYIYNIDKDTLLINLNSFTDIKIKWDAFFTQFKETFILYRFDGFVETKLRIGNILSVLTMFFGYWVKNSYKDISLIRKLLIPIGGTVFSYGISFLLFIGSVIQGSI